MDNQTHKIFIDYFRDKHQKILSQPYLVNWGKDIQIMKSILTLYGGYKTKQLIDAYFVAVLEDPFLKSAGASVGIFKSQIPKLLMQINEKQKDENKGRL